MESEVDRMPYAQYLDLNLNTPSGINASAINHILNGTTLEGLGHSFVDVENKYIIHAIYLLAHAIHESDFGRSQIARDKNNLFGFMAYDSSAYASAKKFSSYAECIDFVAGYIKRQYLTQGGDWYEGATLSSMNVHYATDKRWAVKIAKWMEAIYKQLPTKDYEGHWAEATIEEALQLGIAHGYDDGSFKPDASLTRAEGLSLVMNAYKLLKRGS